MCAKKIYPGGDDLKKEILKWHFRPSPGMAVRYKEAGNVLEIVSQARRSRGGVIVKLNANEYLDKRTGEIREFSHIENRSQDLKSVAKSLARGRDLLNSNILDVSFCRWLTLTYAENMQDSKRLLNDFRKFNVRLRSIVGDYEYITAAEPQARGAWHLHVVLIFPNRAPYIANEIIASCWKKGFVKIKRLDDVDNVGAYLTAYLGDLELSEYSEQALPIDNRTVIKTVECDGKLKRYVKGGRLYMYPPQFHIFRYSRGIRKPIVEVIPNFLAEEKVSGATLTFERTVQLSDLERDFSNVINYRYYNRVR